MRSVVKAMSCALLLVGAFTQPAPGQVKDLLDRAKKAADDIQSGVDEAKAIRCMVDGVCGDIRQSELFAPESYESLAVVVVDPTRTYRSTEIQGVMRDAFEGALVDKGFFLAAASDADQVRVRMARREDAWTDSDLEQLKDFVSGIDAVVVIEPREAQFTRCTVDDRTANQASVGLSVRWVSVDVGDIPWVGTHRSSSACERGVGRRELVMSALEQTASQLAGMLPSRADTW